MKRNRVLALARLVGSDDKQTNNMSDDGKCYGEKQSRVRGTGSAGWGFSFSLFLSQSCIINDNLYKVVRERPAVKMTFEQRSEVRAGESCAHSWKKSILG